MARLNLQPSNSVVTLSWIDIITNAANRNENGGILIGGLRTVLAF
jgi:hypothetical protein